MIDDPDSLDPRLDPGLDPPLEAQLREHLARELDPHLGSALRKLDAMLAAERTLRPLPEPTPARLRIGFRWAAAAVLLVGIGAAGSIVVRYLHARHVAPDQPLAMQPDRAPVDAIVTSWTETYDDGTVLIDPRTPARRLRYVQYEETRWQDADGRWQSKITVPQQDVILLDLVKQ